MTGGPSDIPSGPRSGASWGSAGPAPGPAPARPPTPAPTRAPGIPLLLSVALVSAAAIAVEILYMRLLSIAQWHHFAYMVISLALLGYGASGALLAVVGERLAARFGLAYGTAAALFGVTAVGAFAAVGEIPFSPLEIAWNPRELLGLAAVYLTLSVPFLCAGTAIGLALMAFPRHTGRVYGADLAGAGLGAAGVIGLLFLLPPATCLLALGAAGVAAAAVASLKRPSGGGGGPLRRAVPALLLAAAAGLLLLWPQGGVEWSIEPRISQFKGLPMALRVPGVEVVAERSSPLGLLTAVESRRVPLRHAPGLSLTSSAEPPEQVGVFVDGDSLTTIDRVRDGDWSSAAAYRDDLSSALPYHLLEAPAVLVLGAGGGAGVVGALAQGADSVDAVELDPRMVELVGERFAGFSGHLYDQPRVRVHVGEARGFVAAAEREWDLVEVSLLDSFSASAAGVHALTESHLYTVEALGRFLERLAPGGVLAVTRWLEVPPRGSLKLFATAVAALERAGAERPGERLILVRSWKTATLLVGERPFTPGEVAAARRFAAARGFDLAWAPGMERAEANRFNVWEQPYLHDGAVEVLAGGERRRRFFERYKFFVEPATDDRPYFFRFFKWRVLPELLELRGRGGTHLLEWGYPVVVGTLAQAVLFGLVLIVAPVAFVLRRGERPSGGRSAIEAAGARGERPSGGRDAIEAAGARGVRPSVGRSAIEAAGARGARPSVGRTAIEAAGARGERPSGRRPRLKRPASAGRLRAKRATLASGSTTYTPLGRIGLYFLCLGLGFLFVEIAFIQRFALFLAHPLYAVAVVLAGFLLFAGAGSWAAGRWRTARRLSAARTIGQAVAGVVGLAVLYALALPWAFAVAAGWPEAAKVAAALGLIAPLAFCMGIPFPVGLERVARSRPAGVPWAWAVNGCASVVAAVLATLLAVHFGFTAVVLAASAVYGLAAALARGL